jgi:hypothetical protein
MQLSVYCFHFLPKKEGELWRIKMISRGHHRCASPLTPAHEAAGRNSEPEDATSLAYLPFGSGLGTYPDAHQPFQFDYPTWVNFAHNDYAQAFVESDLLAIAMIGLAFVAYVMQWQRLLTHRFAHPIHLFQACAGISVFALLLHSLVDFNLRIPANALFFGSM